MKRQLRSEKAFFLWVGTFVLRLDAIKNDSKYCPGDTYPVVVITWVHYLGPPGPSTSQILGASSRFSEDLLGRERDPQGGSPRVREDPLGTPPLSLCQDSPPKSTVASFSLVLTRIRCFYTNRAISRKFSITVFTHSFKGPIRLD